MELTYYNHSTFKLKGSQGTVVTDPFAATVGLPMPSLSADIVTISHSHEDHNAYDQVRTTARREKPFIIDTPGEYEVGGISVFGVPTFHDSTQGTERGSNIIFTIVMDGLKICHLGDLGHILSAEQIAEIGQVDVLLCPVGGVYTINPEAAVKTIQALEPSIAIPMHYRSNEHTQDMFAQLHTLQDFLKEYGFESAPVPKLQIDANHLPEETELVVLEPLA